MEIQHEEGQNKTYQDTLILENNQLKQKIQRLEERASSTLQENLHNFDELKQSHSQREQENAAYVNNLKV